MSQLQPEAGTAQAPQIGALIRHRRKQLHLTLHQCSEKAGVSVGYLSQVERDQATPSLGTLAQIAKALGVTVDFFLGGSGNGEALTRSATRKQFLIGESHVLYQQLALPRPGYVLSSYLMDVPPGFVSETVSHAGEEMIYILEGEIDQTVDGHTTRLKAGDSLHYSGSLPHSWSNPTAQAAKLLWVGTLSVLQGAEQGGPPAAHFLSA